MHGYDVREEIYLKCEIFGLWVKVLDQRIGPKS